MLDRKLGWAVVGLGIGLAHADAALAYDRARLTAVCDIDENKLASFHSEHPDVKTYRLFDDLLADPEVDGLSICLPSGMHAEYTVRALKAGKHVLVEKPIDITLEAAEKIEQARLKTGKKVGVVFQNRCNAVMKPIREAVESGKLGKIYLGTFAVKWYRKQSYYDGWHGTWDMDGGGSLINQSIHTVDLMQWLMGDVESVHSTMGIYGHDIETEDMTASVIRFKSGAAATFVSTTCAYPGVCTDIQLYGTEGSVEADADCLKRWSFRDDEDGEEEAEMLETYASNLATMKNDPSLIVGHDTVVRDMIDAVLDGHDPMVLPREAMKSLKIVRAVYESAQTGKTVTF